ncbi:MAG: hypothetical protein RIS70_4449 [Planctomycetota bacterium]
MLATVRSPLASMLISMGRLAGLYKKTSIIHSKRFASKVSSG